MRERAEAKIIDFEAARFECERRRAYDDALAAWLLRFPTVTRGPNGAWRYWAVRDSGDAEADRRRGRELAARTVALLRADPLHDVLGRILRALPAGSATAEGFLEELELILAFG